MLKALRNKCDLNDRRKEGQAALHHCIYEELFRNANSNRLLCLVSVSMSRRPHLSPA